jgi:hypothetical protein
MKLALTLALVGGTALAAQLLPIPAHAGMPGDPPRPTVADLAREAAAQAPVAPPAAPMATAVGTPEAQAVTQRLRADLALARTDLSRDRRIAAERRLDWAATALLNVQQAVRDGGQASTPYDMSATDVIAAYHAARQGDIGTARTMVDGAIQALPASS